MSMGATDDGIDQSDWLPRRSRPPRALLVILGICVALLVVIGLRYGSAGGKTPPRASVNVVSSVRYLHARAIYVGAVAHDAPDVEAAERQLARRIKRDCPGVLGGAPGNHLAGEFLQEVLGVQNLIAHKATSAANTRFAEQVGRLRWTEPRITRMIARLVSARRKLGALPLPNLCRDARGWASTHFRVLTPGTIRFAATLTPRLVLATAEGHGTLEASINALLRGYETAQERIQSGDLERPAFARPSVRIPSWVAVLDALGLSP